MSKTPMTALLFKKGTKLGLLHKRYCELDPNKKQFFLYKNSRKSKLDKVISISAETVISTLDNSKNSFILIISSPTDKTVTFISRDKQIRDEIAFQLRNLILSLPGITMNCFDILSNLGKGYFGKVLLCKRKNSENLYAVKIIKKKLLYEENKIDTGRIEREIYRKCDNPFITKIYFAFDSDTKLYLGLEYIAGGTLDYLNKSKNFKIPIHDIKIYLAEIAIALNYLHENEIVYRDLKCENVLINKDGHIKLIDFGLSKILENDTTHSFCGTPESMPPEMINRLPYSYEVDWWQFGILVFELLYGQRPFHHPNLSKLFELICTANIYFPPQNRIKLLAPDQQPKEKIVYVDNMNKIHVINCLDQNRENLEQQLTEHNFESLSNDKNFESQSNDKNTELKSRDKRVSFIENDSTTSESSINLKMPARRSTQKIESKKSGNNKLKPNRFSLPLPYNQSNSDSDITRIVPYRPLTNDQINIHFISSLLQKDPKDRLTYNEIVSHPFFDGFDFNEIMKMTYQPSFVPNAGQIYFDQDGFVEGAVDSDATSIMDTMSASAFSDFSFQFEQSSNSENCAENEVISRSIMIEDSNLVPT